MQSPFRLFLILALAPCVLFAQKPSDSEVLLHNLIASGFLKNYKDYRAETEMYVAFFKAKSANYSQEDAIRMKTAYRRTSEAFEDFIIITRNDLLNPQKRKSMRKDPEAYVRLRLQTLEQARQEYFYGMLLSTYGTITGDEQAMVSHRTAFIPPEIPLALIIPATKAATELIELIEKNHEHDLELFRELLEKEWVEPQHFRNWEDI